MPDIGPFLPGAPPPRFTSTASGPGIGPLLREFHIPWPAADEGKLREAAAIWHTLAEAIRDNYGPANSTAASLTTNNAGAAITAFETYWHKFGSPKGALPLSAEACDAMSTACTNYANDVASVKRQIEERALEIGAVLVVGAIGAFLTFGATEVGAEVAVAGLAARLAEAAAAWIADIGAEWIAQFGIDLSTTVGLISETAADAIANTAGSLAGSASVASSGDYGLGLASVLGKGVAGLAGGVGSFALTSPLLGPLTPAVAVEQLATSGFTGGLGGVLGELGELSAPQLSSLLADAADGVRTTDPQLASSLLELSKQVAGTTGKIANSVLSSIASQLIVTGQANAESFTTDQFQTLLLAIADRGEG